MSFNKFPKLTRDQLLAAEIFCYSFDNYANHLGIGNPRYEQHMPDVARALEQAERESWSDERIAKAIEVEAIDVPAWRKRFRDALELVDAASPAAAFRNGVRQTIALELAQKQIGEAEIENLVEQLCYRAADLGHLLALKDEKLAAYSGELRAGCESDSTD